MLKSLAIVALAAVLGNSSFGQSLHDFITSQKWDSAKSGVLIGLDTSEVGQLNQNENAPPPADYAAYGRSLNTIGRIKVVAPISRLEFAPEDAPNPYETIPESDRMAAFLGGLDENQWHELSSKGLAPRDFKGFEHNLLLSLVPKYAQKVTYDHNGWSSSNDPTPLDSSALEGTKLQMFKGLDVGFGAMIDRNSQARMWSGISSLNYHPTGAEGWRVSENQIRAGGGGYGGRYVENNPKASALNYRDSRLNKVVPIKTGMTLEDLFAEIRDACGAEIYPDARIAKCKLDAFGDSATAADLLKGVALCLGSTYRKVGPVFILTTDIQGQLTRGAQTMANMAVVENELQYKAIQGRALLDQGHLLDRLDFLPNDQFQAKAFLHSINVSSAFGTDGGWITTNSANSSIQQAIPPPQPSPPAPAVPIPGMAVYQPDPELANKVHLAVSVGTRWITPDGSTIDSHQLNVSDGMTYGFNPPTPVKLPLDPSKQPKGISAGYRSEDPNEVATFCDLASKHGIKEIWLETQSAKALSIAVASGLKVNWLIRPWQVFKGEDATVDLNPLGQTGSKLDAIPVARYLAQRNELWHFTDSIAATDSVPDQHLKLLAKLASTKGLNRIILLDPHPSGYAAPSSEDYARIDNRPLFANKLEIPRNLKDLVPAVYDFGYTQRARVESIRNHNIDLIDLENPNRHSPYVPIPFYENGPGGSHYFSEQDTWKIIQAEEKDRNTKAEAGLKSLLDALGTGQHEIWAQHVWANVDFYRPYYEFGPIAKINDGYLDNTELLSMLSVNPVTAEDANGAINYTFAYEVNHPFCFNFSEVPSNRLKAYFDELFKAN